MVACMSVLEDVGGTFTEHHRQHVTIETWSGTPSQVGPLVLKPIKSR